jgi:hypothetical protein
MDSVVAYEKVGQYVQNKLRVSLGHLFICCLLYGGLAVYWSGKGPDLSGRRIRVLYVWPMYV